MAKITMFGRGTMGLAVGSVFEAGGHEVQYIGRDGLKGEVSDVIILALKFDNIKDVIEKYGRLFDGKIVVDISNPVNFQEMDGLVIPSDTSSAEILQSEVPNSKVVKAFNTNSATMLNNKMILGKEIPTVLLASDHEDAKETLAKLIEDGGLKALNIGSIKRAREMESLGFLQMALAKGGKISRDGGFAILG